MDFLVVEDDEFGLSNNDGTDFFCEYIPLSLRSDSDGWMGIYLDR